MNTPPPALDDKTDEGTIPSNGSKPTVLEKLIEILTSKTRFEPESVHAKEERDIAQSFSLRVRHVLTAKLVRRAITGKFYKEKKDSDLQTGTPADDALAESQTRWNLAHSTLSSILRETGTVFDAQKAGVFVPHATTHWELHDCPSCDGEGKNRCWHCKGTKKEGCPNCGGNKSVPCTNFGCFGGKVNCLSCGGSGHTTHYETRTDYVYGQVNGQSVSTPVTHSVPVQRPCYSCSYGKVLCPVCNGSSSVNCVRCSATGRIPCTTCHGLGHIRCDPCEGSGRVGDAAHIDVHLEPEYSVVLPENSDPSAGLIAEKEGAVGVGRLDQSLALQSVSDIAKPDGLLAEYAGSFSVKRLLADCSGSDYSLVAYGPDLRWLTMDDIVEDLLRKDLDILQQAVVKASDDGFFSTEIASLLEPLKNVVASEVNADLIEALVEGKSSAHAGEGGAVSVKYAEQVKDAKLGALRLVHQRLAKAFWWKPAVAALASCMGVWSFSNAWLGGLVGLACAAAGYFLFDRMALKVLETAFGDFQRARRSVDSAGRSGRLNEARIFASAPAALAVAALVFVLPARGPFPNGTESSSPLATPAISPLSGTEPVKKSSGGSAALSAALELRMQGKTELQREAARKGSEEGALDARGLYSYLVLIGEGLKKPYPSSPEPQFKEAAGLAAQTLSKIPDDPWATLTRAVILMDGLGAPRDLNQGFSLLNGSARNGNPVALHKLGLFYANGSPPVTQNFVAARSFFTQALDRGHVNSAWPLGLLEWRGGAGPANRKRAMELWSMCAKVGHEDCAKAVSQGHP